MKQETKDLLVNMITAWNQFNPQKRVDAHVDDSEFDTNAWSLDVAIVGTISSTFMAFLMPALQVNECHWFFWGHGDKVIFHIQ